MRSLTVGLLWLFAGAPAAWAAAWDKPGWQLTFQDEFDGSAVDATRWGKRYKWGEAQINSELQAYVDDAFQLGNGILTILGEQRPASYAGQTFQYASGVLCSVLEQKYGYFEARLKVPAGQGMWPAFWLLGKVGAPGVNEIDVHEILGNDPSKVYMTVHWGTDYDAGHLSDGTSWSGPDFAADFHVFGLEWNPDSIIWTIDGVERKRHTGDGVPQVEMYIILNLAIGGSWPGPPASTTPFPGLYQIDYVRAYSRLPDAGVADAGGVGGSSGVGGNGAGGSGAGGAVGTGGAATTGGTAGSDASVAAGGAGGSSGNGSGGGGAAATGGTASGGAGGGAGGGAAAATGGDTGAGGASGGGGAAGGVGTGGVPAQEGGAGGGGMTATGGSRSAGGANGTGPVKHSSSGFTCRIGGGSSAFDFVFLALFLAVGLRRRRPTGGPFSRRG
jgi:beta-glucanase (GH16 family)